MRRTSLYRTTTLAILCFSLLLTLTDRMAVVPADYVPEPFRSEQIICRRFAGAFCTCRQGLTCHAPSCTPWAYI